MAAILACGFECGAAGPHMAVTGTTSFDTGTFRNGLTSLRVHPTAALARGFLAINASAGGIAVWRVAVYFASLPTADCFITQYGLGLAGITPPGVRFKQSDSKLYAAVGGATAVLGATGVSVTTGQWYVIDVKADLSANPWTCDAKVDGTDLGQATRAVAADTTVVGVWYGTGQVNGSNETATFDIYFDDIIHSTTAGDYAFGNGKVIGYWPTADGTHTSTTTLIVKGTTATPVGAAITSATTDAWQWVDGPTINDTADFWNQQSNGATIYAEAAFASTAETPRTVEALIALSAAATGANTQKSVLWDGTTADDIYALGTVGVAHPTLTYKRKHYATAPTGAWTTALFNATRVRFGFSSDANPDAYCDNILLEVEYPIVAAAFAPPFRSKSIHNALVR